MSLTSFLNQKDVRKKFREQFPHPPVRRKLKPVVPPLTNHPQLIGTAFDYLLRFYIKRLNPKAITSPWVAENVPGTLRDKIELAKDMHVIDKWKSTPLIDPKAIRYYTNLCLKIEQLLARAVKVYDSYLKDGKIDKPLLKSVILLAQIDSIYRSGEDEYELGSIDQRDLNDLEALIKLVDPKLFKSRKYCVLNPSFGPASRLVGGADADLIIDDMIVEIKTTKELHVKRADWNQLIGYYILTTVGGIEGVGPKYTINRIGIYFSRFGELITVKMNIVNRKRLKSFIEWFVERAGDSKII
jgi:hypothetical protein